VILCENYGSVCTHIVYTVWYFLIQSFVVDCEKASSEKDVNTRESVKDGEESSEPRHRLLHKTQSIFLRNLPPLITRQEIEEVD